MLSLFLHPNYLIKEIATKALNSKTCFVEKPLGKNAAESKQMTDCAMKNNKVLYTGFNHRFHPAILKAKEFVSTKEIGTFYIFMGIMVMEVEKEWKTNGE